MEQKWPRTRSRWTRSTLFSMPSVWLVEDRFNCEERCCYSACLKWCVSSISQQLLKIKPPRMRELLSASTWCVSSMSQQLPRYTPQTQLLKGSKPRKTPIAITKKIKPQMHQQEVPKPPRSTNSTQVPKPCSDTMSKYSEKPRRNRELFSFLLSSTSIYIQTYILYMESNDY